MLPSSLKEIMAITKNGKFRLALMTSHKTQLVIVAA